VNIIDPNSLNKLVIKFNLKNKKNVMSSTFAAWFPTLPIHRRLKLKKVRALNQGYYLGHLVLTHLINRRIKLIKVRAEIRVTTLVT
jgi:hypothetical protein